MNYNELIFVLLYRSSFDDRISATQYASSIGMGKSEDAAFNANVVSACSVQKSHTGKIFWFDFDL